MNNSRLSFGIKDEPADIGSYDIMKVQRKGKGRYLPFAISLQDVKI